jgi:hypothetical protein
MSCEEEINTYDLGDDVYVDGEFKNAAGAFADPTVVYGKTKNPNGTTTIYQYGVDAVLTKVSTGIYRLKIDANLAGEWSYRIYSTGTGKAAAKGKFIADSEF